MNKLPKKPLKVFKLLSRQVLHPLITAATLMTLTSLSGLLSMTFLVRCNFKIIDKKEFTFGDEEPSQGEGTAYQVISLFNSKYNGDISNGLVWLW